jgi:chromosome segregation ATPase
MAIVSVVQGLIETEDGKVFELDSPKGSAWLESISSFRYEPIGANKPYTVRQETKKGGDYWYGYRKVAGKLHKKYIGKSSELSKAKLEEIAEALNTPQQPRVTQVTESSNQQVTETVIDNHTVERVTALELQMQAVRESLESLRSELLGKSEGLGNFSELPNPYKVTDSELQVELGNLKTELSNLATENEKIRADYDALLKSSTVVTNKLREEVQEVRTQLETEKSRGEELWEELTDTEQALAEVRSENSELKKTCAELRSQLEVEKTLCDELREELEDRKETCAQLERKLAVARVERDETIAERDEISTKLAAALAENKKSAAASKDLPEAADLLNQLKSKRKKSKTDLADVETLLEILEPDTD